MSENKKTCEVILQSLSDYVDGILEESLCRVIEDHLASCTDCRVVVDTLQRTVYIYRHIGQEEARVPDDVRERLFKRLDLNDFLKS
jgi:predicted anti-sigma-YlaC factor YlaD